MPIDRRAPAEPELTHDEQMIDEDVDRSCGKKTRQLLPPLIKLLRRRDPCGTWRFYRKATNNFRRGPAEVYVGRPRVLASRLNDLS